MRSFPKSRWLLALLLAVLLAVLSSRSTSRAISAWNTSSRSRRRSTAGITPIRCRPRSSTFWSTWRSPDCRCRAPRSSRSWAARSSACCGAWSSSRSPRASGATVAFLASRYLLRDWVQRKFGDKLKTINEGVEREGAFYLFALRLVPAFPFFVINLVMGLTPIRTLDLLLGEPARHARRARSSTSTRARSSGSSTRSGASCRWQLIVAFVLLGIFPLVAKKVVDALKARRVYAELEAAATLRPQPGGDRRRLGGPRHRVHRRGGARRR